MLALLLSLLGGLGFAASASGGARGAPVQVADDSSGVVPDTHHENDDTAHGDHEDDIHDDEMQDDTAHDGHDDGIQDDREHDGHDDGMYDHTDGLEGGNTDRPQTAEEIEAFVAAVIASPEKHIHDMDSSKMSEHMAAIDLVPRDEATHIAIGDGDWDDPANWHNGEVPGDDARALIPEGVHMTYDHVSEASLFTVRVDGHLDFVPYTDSQMVVDTLIITPGGKLTIGTEDDPVEPDVSVDIIFANNGPIDTDWDPTLLSRGMIAHGTVDIHGAEKDSHDKVIDDPQAGDTWVDFGENPVGWQVGDTIVIAGTHYEGYYNSNADGGYTPPEDEVRVITQIEDGQVFFDDPLIYDHDTPRDDLKTSVANYTRNVSFETEDAETAEIYERGHVMFMHNDDVDVNYAEFHELGRTDKSETALNASEFGQVDFDTNVKGRYSFHFHRAGMEGEEDDPGMATGNAVYGSPGWGFVQHDSNAVLDNNATFNTFGAGFVAESGNETGAWTDNIAIFAKGVDWQPTKASNDVENFDLGRSGDGFWFQGRMIESSDNIAASVNNGFVYFHRGGWNFEDTRNILFDADTSKIPDALNNNEYILGSHVPILEFSGNEAFAAKTGLEIVKGNPNQGHDVHSILEDFTAWSVHEGAYLEYTSHYTLINFDLTGKQETELSPEGDVGIHFGNNVTDMTVVDAKITNFENGIDLTKNLLGQDIELNQYSILDTTFTDVENHYQDYDPDLDDILSVSDLPDSTPDISLDGPLTYKDGASNDGSGAGKISISGTKTDSLGEAPFPGGTDNYDISRANVISTMEKTGYYTTSDDQNYFMLDLYFSDRLTGDIYYESHPVLLDDNVNLQGQSFKDVPFNGILDLEGEDDPTMDAAELWATLTGGQLVLSEDATSQPEEEEALPEDA